LQGAEADFMLLTITTTHRPATDLGYLLHKHPDRCQEYDLSFGRAHVFYTEATDDRCSACLLLDVGSERAALRKWSRSDRARGSCGRPYGPGSRNELWGLPKAREAGGQISNRRSR
jgi:hypothetical protein